jgi:hypothetical protein
VDSAPKLLPSAPCPGAAATAAGAICVVADRKVEGGADEQVFAARVPAGGTAYAPVR